MRGLNHRASRSPSYTQSAMKSLISNARSDLRRMMTLGVQGRLDNLQERLEAVTEAQHADLRRQITELGEHTVEAILTGVRAENVELTRMLRQQGDASDEVAEILGRTLARLGAEVEALSQAVERLEARLANEGRAPAASGVGDPPE
jgi:hypothetical protein